MQYHTGTRLTDKVFPLNTPGVFSPFTDEDMLAHLIPSLPAYSMAAPLPGQLGIATQLVDSFLIHGLYDDARKTLEMDYYAQCLLSLHHLISDDTQRLTIPFTHQSQLAHTLYKLVLSLYLSHAYSAALKHIRWYLTHFPNYHPITGRILTLLMSIEWRRGDVGKAQLLFDAAQDVYHYTLGPNHPLIVLHINCLASLYLHQLLHHQGYLQGKLLLLLGLSKAKSALGVDHATAALQQLKVAHYFICEKKYTDAAHLLEKSTDVLSGSSSSNRMGMGVIDRRFTYEYVLSSYYLSLCLYSNQDLMRARDATIVCIAIDTRHEHWSSDVHLIHLSALLQLSDIYLQLNERSKSVDTLYQTWSDVKAYQQLLPVHRRPLASCIMAKLVPKVFSAAVNALSVEMKTLFDSMVVEWRQSEVLKTVGLLRQQSRELNDTTHDDDDDDKGEGGGRRGGADAVMAMAIEQSLRELTSHVVELLWELDPFEYFAMVMDGVENHALAPIADDDGDGPDLDESMISKHFIPLMGHVAVIASLIEAYHSSSSSSIIDSSSSHMADH